MCLLLCTCASVFPGCKRRPEKNIPSFYIPLPPEAQATVLEPTVRTLTGNTVLQGPQGPPGENGLPGIPGTPGANGAPGADDTCGSTDTNTCNVTPPPGVPGNQLTTVVFRATTADAANIDVFPTYQLSAGDILVNLGNNVMPNNNLWIGFLGPVSSTTSNHPLGINGVVNSAFLSTANTVAFNGNYFVWAIGRGDVRTALDTAFPSGGTTLRNYLIQAGATNALYQMASNTSFAFIGRYGMGRGNGGLFLEHGRTTAGAALLAGPYLFKNHTPTPTRVALNDILRVQDLTPCAQDDLMHWQTDNGVAHWVCTTNSILLNNHFQTATITGADIANGSIVDINIAPGSIESRHIQDGTVLSRHFQNNAIVSEKIANETITSNHVRDGHIEERHFALNGISQESILNGTLTSIHISNASVSSNSISDNALQSRHFTNNSILSVHIANNTLEDNVFADDAITSAKFKTEGGIRFNNSLTLDGNAPRITLLHNGANPSVPSPSIKLGTSENHVEWVLTAPNTLSLKTQPSNELADMVLNGTVTITQSLVCLNGSKCINNSNFDDNSIQNNSLDPSIQMLPNMCIFTFTHNDCPDGWKKAPPGSYYDKALGITNTVLDSSTGLINNTVSTVLLANAQHTHETIRTSGNVFNLNVSALNETGDSFTIISPETSGSMNQDGDCHDITTQNIRPGTYHTAPDIHNHAVEEPLFPDHFQILVCCHND